MSIEAVAAALFIKPATIELLEADAYDHLPAPTFVRGYLRGYARVLGLPSAPILEMYDRQGFQPPSLDPEVSESKQAHTSDTAVRLVTYGVVVVLVLLVGAWWQSQEEGGFGLGGDLFGWSSDAGEEPPLPAAESSGTSPDETDTAGALVAGASRRTDQSTRDGEGSAGDTDSGDDTSAGTIPAGARTGDTPFSVAALPPDATPGEPPPSPTQLEDVASGEAGTLDSATGPQPDPAPGGEVSEPAMSFGEAPAAREAEPGTDPGTGTETTSDDAADEDAPTPESTGDVTDPAGDSAAGAPLAAAPATETETETEDTAPAAGTGTDSDSDSDSGASDTSADIETPQSGLVLEFARESWVEVYDRDRNRLFFNLVEPGKVLHFDAPQPFDILLGVARDVRVTIDGQAFDHTPYSRFGVARFNVGSEETEEVEETTDDAGIAASGDPTTPETGDSPAEDLPPPPDRAGEPAGPDETVR